MKFRTSLVLFLLAWLTTGCTTLYQDLFPETCEQFEARRQDMNYATQYRYSESDTQASAQNFKPLPKQENALARIYKIRFDAKTTRPCTHLTLHKDLYLQRKISLDLRLEEIRDFFAEDGTLITSKREVLSNQLRTTGYYTASVPLPVPKSAPPGKYRVVSRLVAKAKGARQGIVLARASASFQVVAPK
jgi:hypothetical protein